MESQAPLIDSMMYAGLCSDHAIHQLTGNLGRPRVVPHSSVASHF